MNLAPCPSCRRHVNVRDARCPFCAAALKGLVAQRIELPRMSRGAVVVAVLAATGCQEKHVEATADPPAKSATQTVDASPPIVDSTAPDADAEPDADAHVYHAPADIYGGPPLPHTASRPKYGAPPAPHGPGGVL